MRHGRATALYVPGDSVEILDSGIIGRVTEVHTTGDSHRYSVEYIDTHGNPQERIWRERQLDPAGDDFEADAAYGDTDAHDLTNVIAFPRKRAVFEEAEAA
ncbi:MAG: hypothetical protein FD152_2052 [Xanthobacteraceae bacterium]|nr:MAG: hypothetical protein FD152_2052 [Xanthobacteraceae bacterium]